MEDNLDDLKLCFNCKHEDISLQDKPCLSCVPQGNREYWEPKVATEPKPKKKSKWHTYPEEKPKDVTRAFWVWNNDPDPRMMKLHFYVGFDGNNFVTANGSVLEHVTHFRYMPKPPKEYRK